MYTKTDVNDALAAWADMTFDIEDDMQSPREKQAIQRGREILKTARLIDGERFAFGTGHISIDKVAARCPDSEIVMAPAGHLAATEMWRWTGLQTIDKFSTKEAARYLGVHVQTIKNWIAADQLAPDEIVDLGDHKIFRFTRETLDAAKSLPRHPGGRKPVTPAAQS